MSDIHTWQFNFSTLKVIKAQEDGIFSDGDEPYFVFIGFRSKFKVSGSTQVFWSGYLEDDWANGIDSGGERAIPQQMGRLTFGNVNLLSSTDFLNGGQPIEIVGFIGISLESDATPFSEIRDLMNKVRDASFQEIKRLIEDGQIDLANSAQSIQQATQNVQNALQLTTWEKIRLFLASWTDPDDLIGIKNGFFVAGDASLKALFLQQGVELDFLEKKDLHLDFQGDDAHYHVNGTIDTSPWQLFANLGGVFDGQPVSVSWGPGHLEVFIHGNDGAIWHKWWDNGWSGWESLGGNFPNGEISAISWGVGHIEVFVRGYDNAIWHKWWNNGWFGWESLGGELASSPSAVTWGPGHIEVFARGFDNAIWHKWWNNGWFGWESLGGGLLGRPSAVSWGPGHIEVFARGFDNAIWHKWWNNGWFGWESLGGGLASSPSAVTWGPGHIEVFAFAADGHVWHKWWNNGWFGWEDLGGVFDINSQISPESWGVGHLEIFVKGNDNALWHKWWNNGWFGWENLGGDFSSPPNAISWGTGHLNVFVRDNTGIVWQTWWNNDHWGI